MNFKNLVINNDLNDILKKSGINEPTPIQNQSITHTKLTLYPNYKLKTANYLNANSFFILSSPIIVFSKMLFAFSSYSFGSIIDGEK